MKDKYRQTECPSSVFSPRRGVTNFTTQNMTTFGIRILRSFSRTWSSHSDFWRLIVRFPLPERKIHPQGSSMQQRNDLPPINRINAFKRLMIKAVLLSVILFICAGVAPAETKGRIRIGTVENVVLLPWGVTMPARIDTGAATSSLDARNLTVKGNTVEFNLPQQYGGRQIRLPILKWKTVKSAGTKGQRPVVVVELCIGPKRVRTQVNLNDRSNVKYPLIIGRNTLMRDFVVECSTSYCAKPTCTEVTPR